MVVWSGLWKATITPRVGSPATFQSSDGILSSIEIVLQSEGMSSFNFSLINDGGAYNGNFEAGDTVEIWLDPDTGSVGATKRLRGFIKKIHYSRSGVNNTLTLQGFDHKDKFKRTVVKELYRGSRTYEDIISNATDGLLARYASEVSNTGIKTTGKSLGANDTLKFDYVDLFECLTRIQNLIGDWNWQITPALVMNFQPRGYVDTAKEITEFDDVTFTYDDDEMANRIYVFGGRDFTLLSKTAWTGTASLNNGDAPLAYNDVLGTGWDSGIAQVAGQWYKLDLGSLSIFGRMFLDNSSFATKYPRNFKIEASKDNVVWTLITTVALNTSRDLLIDFPQDDYRYVKITLTDADTNAWAIGEIFFYSYYNLLSKTEDAGSIADYGLYEDVIRDSTIVTKRQANDRVRAELKKRKEPSISGVLQLSYFFDVSPNELVLLTLPDTLVNQKFAIERVQYSEDTYGSFKENIDMRSV